MSVGKKCPNCGEEYEEAAHSMSHYFNLVPHENGSDCLKFLRAKVRDLEMRIEDIEHALTK